VKVEQIDHLGIYVKDLDKGAQFFRDVFGFEFSREFGAEGMDVREVVDTRGLDLLAAKSLDGPMARIIEHRGEGLASLSLKVPSLEEGIEEMKSREIRLIHRGDHGDAAKWATFHPKDLFGVFVELVEYHPENLYLSAARKPPAVLYPRGGKPPKVKVEGIDHVGIYVKDLDRAVQVLEDLFSLKFSPTFGPEDEDVLQVMDSLGINLMAPKTTDGPMAQLIKRRGEGLSSLTFKVPDIEKAIVELTSLGIRQVKRGQYGENAKWATFHPKDIFGVFINLVEYHALHPYLALFEDFQE